MTAGEDWVDGLLVELRAGAYRPAAWRTFLARSFARAANARRERAAAHRKLVWLALLGAAAWTGLALGGRPVLALAAVSWLALLLLMADWHLGMLEDDRGRPQSRLGAANLLSIARGAFVPVFLVLPPAGVAALLLLTGAGDVLDGIVARRRGEETRLGRWLDGGVDAVALGVAAISTARLGLLPWWAAGLVLARHASQWSALSLAYFGGGERRRRRERFVSARAPGLVLFLGLVLAALDVRGATAIVATGALAGVATVALSAVRTLRPAVSR